VSLWRLEKGISVGLLEQLQGSLTLVSALQLTWLLRNFRLVTLVLVSIWVLSPLGGQAGLRILSIGIKPVQSDFSLYYLSPTTSSVFYSASGLDSSLNVIDSVFTASILADIEVQNSFVDNWGNVKVPWLEMINMSTADDQGWIETTQNSTTFTSLVGVPVVGLSNFNQTSYTMGLAYYFMDCPQAMNVSYQPYFTPSLISGESELNHLPSFQTLNFTTNPPVTNVLNSPYNITLASLNNGTTASVANCALHVSNVEVNVSCTQGSCGVAYIRRSPSPVWSVGGPGYFAQPIVQMLRFLPSAAGLPEHEATSTLIEGFICNNSDPQQSFSKFGWVDLTKVSSNDLSVRFTQLFNTYYFASLDPFLITDPESVNISDSGMSQTDATGTSDQVVYILQNTWIVIWFLCLGILFGAAVCNAVLGRIVLAPDIIGYASTLTRENSNIPLPPGGSTLSGIDRALLLKETCLRIGDAREDNNDVGSLRIRLGDGIASLGKLDKNMVYT
jgi:hypothetical protein